MPADDLRTRVARVHHEGECGCDEVTDHDLRQADAMLAKVRAELLADAIAVEVNCTCRPGDDVHFCTGYSDRLHALADRIAPGPKETT
jgi:hypothetical protein